MIRTGVLMMAAALLLAGAAHLAAQAPRRAITVFVGGAMTQPARDAGSGFSRATGAEVVYVSDTTGGLQRRLASGEKADVIIVTAPAVDALEKDGRVVAGSRVDLARALIGVGVRAGSASPDLSSVEAFKAALVAARSVSYVNPASGGVSGTYFEGLLKKLGIADEMKPKTVYRSQGSEVAAAVASGEAAIGITFTSELQPNTGVKVAGPLPADIQLPTIYAGAIVTGAPNADGGRAFLAALSGPDGHAVLQKASLEPIAPRK